jgi:hypothetical protein
MGTQVGGFKVARQAPVVPVLGFAVHEEPEAGGELQLAVAVGRFELVRQGGGQSGQAQAVQLFQGVVDQHG